MRSTNTRSNNKNIDNRKKMKKCSECNGKMEKKLGKTPEGVSYTFFKCLKCGEEILFMNQLHNVAEKYREMKRFKVKLNKWGLSLGLRIPKELVYRYKLNDKKEVLITEEDNKMVITIV